MLRVYRERDRERERERKRERERERRREREGEREYSLRQIESNQIRNFIFKFRATKLTLKLKRFPPSYPNASLFLATSSRFRSVRRWATASSIPMRPSFTS